MYQDDETLVSPTGLRYTSKQGGSPFQGMGRGGETLSCIKCGHHKPRTKGTFKRYGLALFFFCLTCKPKLAQ